MLPHIRHVAACRPSWSPSQLAKPIVTARTYAKKIEGYTETEGPVAEKLHKAGIWNPRKRTGKGVHDAVSLLQTQDARRVNIVGEKLCGKQTLSSLETLL